MERGDRRLRLIRPELVAGQRGASWARAAPSDPKGWLITASWRVFLDLTRSDRTRKVREERYEADPPLGQTAQVDDTLQLYLLCTHRSLSPSSAVALTLRAVGGLTTKQIAEAYLVPEATMAQRISRAKRTVSGVRLDERGDLGAVSQTLYLVFNEGYTGDVDLAAEAIRLTLQLSATVDEPEVRGLLALMLLHHARRTARFGVDGRLIPLVGQDRGRWDQAAIAEGVVILRANPAPYNAGSACVTDGHLGDTGAAAW